MGAFNRVLMAVSSSLSRGRGLSSLAVAPAPWLMLPSNEVADTFTSDAELRRMDYSFYRLSEKDTISLRNKTKGTNPIPHDAFCFGSSKGWLLYSDPADCTLFLTNPLVASPPTIPLPPVTTLHYIHATIGCSRKNNNDNKIEPEGRFSLIQEFARGPPQETYSQIMLNFSVSSASPDSKDCVIMVIQSSTKSLSFCKPALKMEAWIRLEEEEAEERERKAWLGEEIKPAYTGMVYSSKEQLFYTKIKYGGIVTWDLRDHLEPKREAYQPVFNTISSNNDYEDWIRYECFTKEFLVESSGDILLVYWHHCRHVDRNGKIGKFLDEDPLCNLPDKTKRFDVYKLNEAKDSWEQLKSLGDRVLFLGMNEPFSLSSSDYPELKPNSIYFIGHDGNYMASDWGIYDLNDHTVTCHYPCSYWSKLRPPPIWIQILK